MHSSLSLKFNLLEGIPCLRVYWCSKGSLYMCAGWIEHLQGPIVAILVLLFTSYASCQLLAVNEVWCERASIHPEVDMGVSSAIVTGRLESFFILEFRIYFGKGLNTRLLDLLILEAIAREFLVSNVILRTRALSRRLVQQCFGVGHWTISFWTKNLVENVIQLTISLLSCSVSKCQIGVWILLSGGTCREIWSAAMRYLREDYVGSVAGCDLSEHFVTQKWEEREKKKYSRLPVWPIPIIK